MNVSNLKKEIYDKGPLHRDVPSHCVSADDYHECVMAMVTPNRFEHILRVSALAEEIARANAFDVADIARIRVAAVLHDVARDLNFEEIFQLSPPEFDLERQYPLSLHGRAGRVIAELWGVADQRILEAISGHVFGVSKNNRIGMVVYVADVSEPGRGVNGGIRELAMVDLFRAYQLAVEAKVKYLRSEGKAVHPETIKAYEDILDTA